MFLVCYFWCFYSCSELPSCSGISFTFNTGVRNSATPRAVPFTVFITFCMLENLPPTRQVSSSVLTKKKNWLFWHSSSTTDHMTRNNTSGINVSRDVCDREASTLKLVCGWIVLPVGWKPTRNSVLLQLLYWPLCADHVKISNFTAAADAKRSVVRLRLQSRWLFPSFCPSWALERSRYISLFPVQSSFPWMSPTIIRKLPLVYLI